jgi:hypothetical protein
VRAILPTDREMIPARNTINAHARDCLANDELLLPILQAFAQCTRTLLERVLPLCVQRRCSVVRSQRVDISDAPAGYG